jgi:predicted RNA-binding Zn ribbon-like protein
MSQPHSKSHFDLSGGNLALDFVNTVSYRVTEPVERLTNYNKLVFFGLESGVYRGSVDDLYIKAGQSPGLGKSALQKAIEFREALYAIFSAIVERRAIPGNALTSLNFMLLEAMAHVRVVQNNRRFVWEWQDMDSYLGSVLWPVARAAADLMTSDEIQHLRMCAAEDCAWLFLDKTKNQRRRWCDMKTCGNRVKARRHYERVKAE